MDRKEQYRSYLAVQLDQHKHHEHARTFREWSTNQYGLFAQAWVSAVGRKPA